MEEHHKQAEAQVVLLVDIILMVKTITIIEAAEAEAEAAGSEAAEAAQDGLTLALVADKAIEVVQVALDKVVMVDMVIPCINGDGILALVVAAVEAHHGQVQGVQMCHIHKHTVLEMDMHQ